MRSPSLAEQSDRRPVIGRDGVSARPLRATLRVMERSDQPLPEDATEATDEQREMQEQLDHQHDDPEAPGRHESRHQISDEN